MTLDSVHTYPLAIAEESVSGSLGYGDPHHTTPSSVTLMDPLPQPHRLPLPHSWSDRPHSGWDEDTAGEVPRSSTLQDWSAAAAVAAVAGGGGARSSTLQGWSAAAAGGGGARPQYAARQSPIPDVENPRHSAAAERQSEGGGRLQSSPSLRHRPPSLAGSVFGSWEGLAAKQRPFSSDAPSGSPSVPPARGYLSFSGAMLQARMPDTTTPPLTALSGQAAGTGREPGGAGAGGGGSLTQSHGGPLPHQEDDLCVHESPTSPSPSTSQAASAQQHVPPQQDVQQKRPTQQAGGPPQLQPMYSQAPANSTVVEQGGLDSTSTATTATASEPAPAVPQSLAPVTNINLQLDAGAVREVFRQCAGLVSAASNLAAPVQRQGQGRVRTPVRSGQGRAQSGGCSPHIMVQQSRQGFDCCEL